MPNDNYSEAILTNISGKKKGDRQAPQAAGIKNTYSFVGVENLEYKVLNKCIQNYVNFAQETICLPVYKAECLDKRGVTSGKNRTIFYFCESLQIGQEINNVVSGVNLDLKNSDSFKDRYRGQDNSKVFDITLKYLEHLEPHESQNQEMKSMKKEAVGRC